MVSLTIKNIPENLYQILKRNAKEHRRSLNSEIILCLEQFMEQSKPNTTFQLHEARRIREKTSHYRINQKKLNAAKERGRP